MVRGERENVSFTVRVDQGRSVETDAPELLTSGYCHVPVCSHADNNDCVSAKFQHFYPFSVKQLYALPVAIFSIVGLVVVGKYRHSESHFYILNR